MAKKKEKSAAKEETVQAADGDAEDDEVADDNSPGIQYFCNYIHLGSGIHLDKQYLYICIAHPLFFITYAQLYIKSRGINVI